MPYRIAGIDVHKKMLAVAVADVEVEGDVHFERLGRGPMRTQSPAHCTLHKRNRIGAPAGASETFPTRSVS
jgi:hypothetical protein